MAIEEDGMLAYDIYLRLSFARSELEDIMEKHGDALGLSEQGKDLYYWIEDIRYRIIDTEREVTILNPAIREYVDEDIR